MFEKPTSHQIEAATKKELQQMLKTALNENLDLEATIYKARMSAAHEKLHFSLLSIESEETRNRLEVENYMFRREAAIMHQTSLDTALSEYCKRLKEHYKRMKEYNIMLHTRLKQARSIIKTQNSKLVRTQQLVDLLQERIRQNRSHFNEIYKPHLLNNRSPTLFHVEEPQESFGISSHNISSNTNSGSFQRNQEFSIENQENFNALLLAGSLLNQEDKNENTPTMACYQLRNSSPHFQGRHSKITGHHTSKYYVQNPSTLLSPVRFSSEADLELKSHSEDHYKPCPPRCKSRDSTISASDIEELAYPPPRNAKQNFQNKSHVSELKRTIRRNKREVSLPIQCKDPCSYDGGCYQMKLGAPLRKRKREGERHWWDTERRKANKKELLELAIG